LRTTPMAKVYVSFHHPDPANEAADAAGLVAALS
jgi:hypothetical protein